MAGNAFPQSALDGLGDAYPLAPAKLSHAIADHPLLSLDALAGLARRMRPASLEHNAAVDLPLGISNAETPYTGLDVHETIARIETCGSWVLLKSIEQDPAYARLMADVLGEIAPVVEPVTGAMLRFEAFIFISSPRAVTPLHFDPEYNILFQARGSKTMTLFPTADPEIVSQQFFEAYFAGGPRNLPWNEAWRTRSREISIAPGEGIYVPILAPHWVQTHDEVSVSLSLTWRSEWSFHHADACRMNRRLRHLGLTPSPPRIYPANNRVKSYGQRALARIERLLPAD
ncbi:cupin-like domain-containing protein [Novosphingobium sp. PC22D]|uniref:cupin-like domain-containing protein n=1 Tax=Novosphingobium sp. PC22D TaxID=1962403 RepID=UPI000BEFEF22|nr:cupin-like domain-containing protein [Novosphingobium sp. PC22D]